METQHTPPCAPPWQTLAFRLAMHIMTSFCAQFISCHSLHFLSQPSSQTEPAVRTDQRSTLPVIEKPMEYDFELEKVRQIGLESVGKSCARATPT